MAEEECGARLSLTATYACGTRLSLTVNMLRITLYRWRPANSDDGLFRWGARLSLTAAYSMLKSPADQACRLYAMKEEGDGYLREHAVSYVLLIKMAIYVDASSCAVRCRRDQATDASCRGRMRRRGAWCVREVVLGGHVEQRDDPTVDLFLDVM